MATTSCWQHLSSRAQSQPPHQPSNKLIVVTRNLIPETLHLTPITSTTNSSSTNSSIPITNRHLQRNIIPPRTPQPPLLTPHPSPIHKPLLQPPKPTPHRIHLRDPPLHPRPRLLRPKSSANRPRSSLRKRIQQAIKQHDSLRFRREARVVFAVPFEFLRGALGSEEAEGGSAPELADAVGVGAEGGWEAGGEGGG